MLERRLARPALVGAVAAIAVLAASGCADQNAAIKVGDRSYSEADFQDELEAYAENDDFWEIRGATADRIRGELAGSYSQEFVCEVIGQRVQFLLVRQMFENQGLELTDGDRQLGRQLVQEQLGDIEGFPRAYQDLLAADFGRIARLQEEVDPQELEDTFGTLAEETEIEVSPRYGTWDEQSWMEGQPCPVTPPEGPRPASPGAERSSEGGPAGPSPSVPEGVPEGAPEAPVEGPPESPGD